MKYLLIIFLAFTTIPVFGQEPMIGDYLDSTNPSLLIQKTEIPYFSFPKLFIKKGIKLIKLDIDKTGLFDLALVLDKIYSLGCRNLLVEGGKFLTNSFIKHDLFNQFYLFQKNNKLGRNKKLNMLNLLNQLSFKYKNKTKLNKFTESDIIYQKKK